MALDELKNPSQNDFLVWCLKGCFIVSASDEIERVLYKKKKKKSNHDKIDFGCACVCYHVCLCVYDKTSLSWDNTFKIEFECVKTSVCRVTGAPQADELLLLAMRSGNKQLLQLSNRIKDILFSWGPSNALKLSWVRLSCPYCTS